MIASPLICNPQPEDRRIGELVERLLRFYAKGTDYTAFQSPAVLPREWATMWPIVDELLDRHERIAVLELGAGRSAFGSALGKRRSRIDYDVQDVTTANVDHLRDVADRVLVQPIEELSGGYDMIFSTFVFEHVATPVSFLENVNRLLKPGGWHVMICPRYDIPAYICPSLRRRALLSRCAAAVQLAVGKALSLLDGQPRFYINLDPAMLHGPWFRDADAINIVTRRAVELWHGRNGFRRRRLHVTATTPGQWINVSFMLLADAFQKV